VKKKTILLLLLLTFLLLLGGAGTLYNQLSEQTEQERLAQTNQTGHENDQQDNAQEPERAEESREAYPAPDFTVFTADGEEVSLSDYLGTPVVLNFWASWCGPCKSEMPDFHEKAAEYDGQIQFMMVNLTDGSRETVESASAFIEEQGYTFPVFFDTQYSGAAAYGTSAIPVTFFIDREGNLIAYAQSAIDAETLQEGIDMILPQS